MARPKKIYTQEEVNAMTEKRMQKLFEEGRINDDMWQRWYDNQEETRVLTEQATEEVIEEDTKVKEENAKMERANKCTVQAIEEGYEVRFYRTHKYLGNMIITTCLEEPNGKHAHSNELRETSRMKAINECITIGIEWSPDQQKQAWERKYNTYMTDEEVAEDALTLVTPAVERLVEKCKFDMKLQGIEITAITPKESNLSYVENGRYTKSGAWCTADIEVTVKVEVMDTDIEILYNMEMKSGQICKPKTTIADWDLMVIREMELCGIEISVDEEK